MDLVDAWQRFEIARSPAFGLGYYIDAPTGAVSSVQAAWMWGSATTNALATFVAIVLMAVTSYRACAGGCTSFRQSDAIAPRHGGNGCRPGLRSHRCVLISVIGPHFVSGQPADLAAVGLTELVATRLSFLPTVLIGVVNAGLLRYLLPVWPSGLSR